MTPPERFDPVQLLKLILAIAVCAALVAAAMYSTPHETSTFGSPAPTPASHAQPPTWHGLPNFEDHPHDAAVELQDLMRKTRGDFSLLTPEQQSWANGYTRGNAKRMFDEKASELQKKPTVRH